MISGGAMLPPTIIRYARRRALSQGPRGVSREGLISMSKRVAVMLDGGHLRVYARKAGRQFDPNYIEKIALACAQQGEEIFRVLYYDCAPFSGTLTLPVTGAKKSYDKSDKWLH